MNGHSDIHYACDHRWWNEYHERIKNHRCVKITPSEKASQEFKLDHIKAEYGRGLNKKQWTVNCGMNSGYQAINLAYHLGAKEIYLLGFDMQRTNGLSHFHGDHPKGWANGGDYSDWIKRIGELASDLRNEGVKVVNCSRQTALECFERSTIEDVIKCLM